MSDPQKYTVGWICAISTELVAAIALLDEKHDQVESVHHNDNNTYTLGRMGRHNIVIAAAPDGEYGTQSAATVARDMVHSFPNVRIGLMVGIAGGAPSAKHDIRLGDIVVSAPRDGKGGVFQYDFGRQRQGQDFQNTAFLDQPPPLLRTAVAALRAQYEYDGHQVQAVVHDTLQKKSRLRKKYQRPDLDTDRLYRSDIVHPSSDGRSCVEACRYDQSQLIIRPPRTEDEDNPTIFYGLVASANRVMKDAISRDIAAQQGVLAFEMEAAGLMNHFPCLVIRGICDYADSHKNKAWQGYAAMTAAAYAKDLLRLIAPNQVEAQTPMVDVLREVGGNVTAVREDVQEIVQRQRIQDDEDILRWLTPVEYHSQHNDFRRTRQPGTGQWLLNLDEFRAWRSVTPGTLFCHGMPGAGKTILTSIVVDHLSTTRSTDDTVIIAYIYCSYSQRGPQGTQKVYDILASVLKQLAQSISPLPESVRDLHKAHHTRQTRPSRAELVQTLRSIMTVTSRTYVALDALDSLSDDSRLQVLSELFMLQKETKMNIFITSRPTFDVEKEFRECIRYDSLVISATEEDVKTYLDSRVSGLRMTGLDSLRKEIVEGIAKAAAGMFLLARLYFDLLGSKKTVAMVKKALQELHEQVRGHVGGKNYLNRALTDAYTSTIARIQEQDSDSRDLAYRVLSWVTCAKRPLTSSELRCALAVEADTSKLDDENRPDTSLILTACHRLVMINTESQMVQLVHETTKEYLDTHSYALQSCYSPGTLSDAETYLAETCLTYLSYDTFQGGCIDRSFFGERLRQHALLDYAARHWGDHVRQARQEVQFAIPRFLEHEGSADSAAQVLWYSDWGPFRVNASGAATQLAAYFGAAEIMLMLLEKGYSYNNGGYHGMTSLHHASENGHEAVVRLLLEKGASLNAVDSWGRTPLFFALGNGHEAVAQLLIKDNPRFDRVDADGQTPLHWASEHGHEAVVQLLVQKGAKVDRADEDRQTPLHLALMHGHEAVARRLIKEGAEVNKIGRNNQTPLVYASGNGHETVARLLIKESAEVDKADINGRTPLHWASENGHETVARLLIEESAEVNKADINGRTPLHWASENGHETVARLLIKESAEVNKADINGRTPLYRASENGYKAVVELLLKKGAKLDIVDNWSRTPLYRASERGHEVVALLLIKEGAEVNVVDRYGRSPLYRAFEHGQRTVAQLLITHGARH